MLGELKSSRRVIGVQVSSRFSRGTRCTAAAVREGRPLGVPRAPGCVEDAKHHSVSSARGSVTTSLGAGTGVEAVEKCDPRFPRNRTAPGNYYAYSNATQ
jgi:hypothetical protein